jgi:hypothetical protein
VGFLFALFASPASETEALPHRLPIKLPEPPNGGRLGIMGSMASSAQEIMMLTRFLVYCTKAVV